MTTITRLTLEECKSRSAMRAFLEQEANDPSGEAFANVILKIKSFGGVNSASMGSAIGKSALLVDIWEKGTSAPDEDARSEILRAWAKLLRPPQG